MYKRWWPSPLPLSLGPRTHAHGRWCGDGGGGGHGVQHARTGSTGAGARGGAEADGSRSTRGTSGRSRCLSAPRYLRTSTEAAFVHMCGLMSRRGSACRWENSAVRTTGRAGHMLEQALCKAINGIPSIPLPGAMHAAHKALDAFK
eukprot:m.818628 g.818628  ORF g.818628 m.818628 type:complete len:146 (+) comp23394_c0_seq189:2219-2656(+)